MQCYHTQNLQLYRHGRPCCLLSAPYETSGASCPNTVSSLQVQHLLKLVASIMAQAAQEMDPSTKLPADDSVGLPGQIVIGSLDMNQGAVLPSEELVGKLPAVW
eukprot:GHRR01027758.1.p2 GENE.GHRR01027758.1~~GHRR01027758.1.p2  ORF type:complete len:104 (+),score=14.79 GHRR01027758.1:672-983(+)